VLDGLTIRPTPVQRPAPPVWIALRRGNPAPLRRAVRHDGMFPIEVETPDQLAEIVAEAQSLRPADAGAFDVAVGGPVGTDTAPYEAAGATWWMASFSPYEVTLETVRAVAREGPS
jgi:alkanesulfonate monooxygenase SsuD/methylene tetrahydromethanopterin reductase-like flavin-dependent oxidoreductase (luciferase family)